MLFDCVGNIFHFVRLLIYRNQIIVENRVIFINTKQLIFFNNLFSNIYFFLIRYTFQYFNEQLKMKQIIKTELLEK